MTQGLFPYNSIITEAVIFSLKRDCPESNLVVSQTNALKIKCIFYVITFCNSWLSNY